MDRKHAYNMVKESLDNENLIEQAGFLQIALDAMKGIADEIGL